MHSSFAGAKVKCACARARSRVGESARHVGRTQHLCTLTQFGSERAPEGASLAFQPVRQLARLALDPLTVHLGRGDDLREASLAADRHARVRVLGPSTTAR